MRGSLGRYRLRDERHTALRPDRRAHCQHWLLHAARPRRNASDEERSGPGVALRRQQRARPAARHHGRTLRRLHGRHAAGPRRMDAVLRPTGGTGRARRQPLRSRETAVRQHSPLCRKHCRASPPPVRLRAKRFVAHARRQELSRQPLCRCRRPLCVCRQRRPRQHLPLAGNGSGQRGQCRRMAAEIWSRQGHHRKHTRGRTTALRTLCSPSEWPRLYLQHPAHGLL